MASKYQLITDLYESTIQAVTNTPAAWTAFLRSACRNYKCRFDEQILIYAQRPDATAVLEIEKWNEQFGRWVNRGATGIAVFDDEHDGRYRLKHYFDISDTHESRFARRVPLWQMEPRFESEVIESLENSFGELEDKATLADALISAAHNAVDDNLSDYLNELMYCREDSFLEELDDLNIEVEYRTALQNSVAYMLLTRCGIDTENYLEPQDFRYAADFNTRSTVNALGLATSDIAELCLLEIAATVRNLRIQERDENRTFAKPESPAYSIPIKQNNERSADNGTDLSDGGRLPRTKSDRAGGIPHNPWQIRIAPQEVSEAAPPRSVPESPDGGNAERTPDGDRADGHEPDRAAHRADGGGAGRDGEAESRESNAMGGADEQHPALGGGIDSQRPDLQLKPLPTISDQLTIFGEAEEPAKAESSAFSISQQIIDEVLTSGGNEQNSPLRIVSYFKKDYPTAENADFLRQEFIGVPARPVAWGEERPRSGEPFAAGGSDKRSAPRRGGKGFIFGGNHVSVWFDESGIRIATGDTILTPAATLVTYEQAAKRIRELLDMGRYMPQSELDKTDSLEIKTLAEQLWYLERDLIDGVTLPGMDKKIFKGGFPDSTARIAEFIAQPEHQIAIIDGLNLLTAYEQGGNFLRFRSSERHLRHALTGLVDLQREPLLFTADETASTARAAFITQDEVDQVLMRGGNISHGKFRIYSYFLQGHTAKEKADFLKKEYGIGGNSRLGFDEWHDSKGIAYSRENNHMPYDKVILTWPRVVRRIDELIAEGRYMSQRELDYIPEYEREELAREVVSFYPYQPEDLPRPFPNAVSDYGERVKIVRPQLDQPERVAKILSQMADILDNTADFDRNYTFMQEAFSHLTAWQNGTFSLFTPVEPTEQAQAAASAQPVAPATSPIDEAAEYDLQLGATVYLGIEEYEINAFDDARVELRDAAMPLFTREMPRDEFDRRLRENRLNDGLIKAKPDPVTPSATADTPRVLYKKYLAELVEEIMQSEVYSFLRDPDTQADEAEDTIGAFVDAAAASEDYPGLEEAFALSEFREWLIEDILDRTYQDVSIGSDGVELHERDADAADWVQRPPLEEHIREDLSLRGFVVSDELIAVGIDAYSSHYGMGDHEVIAEFIESEYLNEEPVPDQEPELIPPSQAKEPISGLKEIVIDLTPRSDEPPVHSPRFTPKRVSYVDVISSNPPRVDIADKTHAYGIWDSESNRYLKNNDQSYLVFDTLDEADQYADTLNKDTITPAWEKPKPRSRTQTFDPHPEIPQTSRHNFTITDDALGVGGEKAKYRYNVEAIKTLQAVESENRFATPEEQDILSRYVGWGGLADVFDEEKSSWANEHLELKALLSPDEYASARASTVNAHYTTPVVIKAIYQAIENMGFKTGNILEPSCGIGNFFGLVPESMQDSKLYGVELDSVTGRIAQQLYQKNSIAVQGFEKTNLPDSFFDLAVGNVPFGQYKVLDKRYDKLKFSIHDYFFAKTLDKVRPGGVIAFVTSKYTMDKQNPDIRRYIAQRADLLGVIRLPNNAFKANAGTEVTADIIFLQKRDRMIDIEPDWVHLGKTEDGIALNSYFLEHPDMLLGEMTTQSTAYGHDTTCKPFENADLSALLHNAIANIHAEIPDFERGEDEPDENNSIPADPSVRNFSYTLVDGKIYYRQDSRMVPVEMPVTAQNRVKGLVELRECVRRLIEYQAEDYPESDIRTEQARLNRLYDGFTKKYGLINSRGNSMAFGQDSAYCLLCSLEIIDENGELERKADMFQKRTIKPHIPITHVDTASEALAVSMSEKARVDLEYMAELTGQSCDALIKELEGVIFLNVGAADSHDKTYVTADEYLSGNVREKLVYARAAQAALGDGSLDINVSALEAAIPPDLTAAEISVRLGATWLPEEVIQKFMYELLQTSGYARDRTKVHYSDRTGEWSITEKNADRSNIHTFNTYGTQRINAYKIIEDSLNLRDVRVFDKVYDPDGNEKRVLNKKETAIAQAKQEIIRAKFEEWIWKDPARRERLCRIYNDRFNSVRPREYDGSHIKFVGMNPEITLRKHQIDAIAHILYGGNTLLAHEVGAGKTYEMVAAAMESKRLGLCNKSLIVVPNHITEQWSGEFLQLYPSANILVATKKDFETKNRKKFCARIATGDYDAVIIGHSQFEKIPMSLERQRRMIDRQIDDLVDAIDETKRNKGERYTIKQLERMKKSLEVKLAKLSDQSRKDDVVTFEELGIDRLFIDEAHYFKNLFLITKMRNVGGIAQVEAQKSSDLFMKTQYLDELTGGRGTVFATGTPISNSMVEMYTMQRYLQYKALVQNGLQHFDAWASTFGETVTSIELAPEGTGYRAKTRFAKFYNLPELMSMFRMVADIQTADTLHLPVPKANFHTEVIRPSQWQQDMIAELAERAERIRNREVDPATDNMLKVTNDGRKLALDQRLINPLLPDDPDGKVAACAANVFRIWEQHREKRLTQLVFCDLSTPKGKKSPIEMKEADGAFVMDEAQFWNVYEDLKAKLTAKGIPEHEIAFIHNADTEAKKKELFAKVRKGQIRVLMGSTQKMGAGTNVQDRLGALHDLDCPWRPSDLAQRLGRIVRQGNKNDEVDIFRYVTEGTFDSYLYQLVENKQKFISQIMTSKLPVRSAEDVDETALSYAEIKALATGNPLIIEKCQMEMDVSKLKILHASHLSQKYALEDKILKEYPQEIKRQTERITGYKIDAETAAKHPADKDHFPPMKIGGILYAEKAEAGKAMIEACKAMTSPDPVALGEYRGFQMILSFDSFAKEYRVTLSGALSHTVALGSDIHGNITRLDNALERFAESLQNCEAKLEESKTQLAAAKSEVDRPFPQEQEYTEKSARLKELNILLNMDEKDHEILDAEPDEGDMAPVKTQAWAR